MPGSRAARSVSDQQAMEQFEELLRGSVKSQLLSDVKVGCQLSGGIDSSLVACSRARTSTPTWRPSRLSSTTRRSPSSRGWHRRRGGAGVSHHVHLYHDFFFVNVNKASWHMDETMGHPNSVGIWLLAQRGARLRDRVVQRRRRGRSVRRLYALLFRGVAAQSCSRGCHCCA